MEGLTETVTILTIIRDVYPVSFIAIIHGILGYGMAMYKYRMELKFMEDQIKRYDHIIEVLN